MTNSNPFDGDWLPSRVPLFAKGRRSLPFPHPWNYKFPIRILETFFHDVDHLSASEKHNRYLYIPGFPKVLVSRDPGVIKAILFDSGDKPGQFDRDTLPTDGIARLTGEDTMLYANGEFWRAQKKLAAPSFGRSNLFQPETLIEFEQTFRETAAERLKVLVSLQKDTGSEVSQLTLEPEINAIMLEMLVNNFFGGNVSHSELRERYVPSINKLIQHMVLDTIANYWMKPLRWFEKYNSSLVSAKEDFEALTDIALTGRRTQSGMWKKFKSDASDEQLRSNIRVFLAGAMEATSSFAAWTLTHLSRNLELQDKLHAEVSSIDSYGPKSLQQAHTLNSVMEETLRLTPALYFLPRLATVDTWIETPDQHRMCIPKGTHVLLDVWHANRSEDHWGEELSGYPADTFAPERWAVLKNKGLSPKDTLHFGFGFGPRTCPGVSLGRLEVALVVGAFVKLFKFKAINNSVEPVAGVSTKPSDGVQLEVELREPYRSLGQQ